MRCFRELLAQLLRLDWMVPHRGLPHGLCGCASLICGGVIVYESLSGTYEGVQGPLLLCYCFATAANSVAGYHIAGRAPICFRVFFQCAAVFQLCLVYYVWRFSPLWLQTWPAATSAADIAVASMIPFNIAAFIFAGFVHLPLLAAVAVLFGSFGLVLLAVYPAQLAFGGEQWWQCVQAAYPQQSVGMVAYIYVPATVTFSAMLFGATLWLRRIIGDLIFGGVFLGLVLATLVGTVLMQEVYMPGVSTQRLYLPCPAPPAGSWQANLADSLDTSALAQSILARSRRVGLNVECYASRCGKVKL